MIFFPRDDFKYREWSKELNKLGIDTYADKKSSVFAWLTILTLIIKKENVSTCIFRYMNDRPSLIKSIILACSDLVLIYLCKTLSIRILWILHNVDKETHEYHPRVTNFRRNLLKKHAEKICVTDPLLVEHAKRLGFPKRKLDWICFGRLPKQKSNPETEDLKAKIIELKKKLSQKYKTKDVFIGLCISSPVPKFMHFLYADHITNPVYPSHGIVGLVLYGKIPKGQHFRNIGDEYDKNDRVLHVPKNNIIDEYQIKNHVDFIYRSVDDLSVSYSIYVAASIQKPIITHDIGFIPELVKKNRIGKIIPLNKDQASKVISEFLVEWDPVNSDIFLNKFNWASAAKKLKRLTENDTCIQ